MLCPTDTLGKVIKTARLEKGLTRDQLSEKLGISPRYLMSIEHEGKKPSYDVLFQIIRQLALNADDIFYPERDSTPSERKRLLQMLKLCDEHEIAVVIATVQALISKN